MSTVLKRIEANKGYLSDLLDRVDEPWRSEFERFVETGEADDSFLNYLDQNKAAQEAVETAFKRQAAKFEEWAGELQRRQTAGTSELPVTPASITSIKVASVVEDGLQATSAERDEVVAQSTAALAKSIPAEEAIEVKEVLKSIERGLAEAAALDR